MTSSKSYGEPIRQTRFRDYDEIKSEVERLRSFKRIAGCGAPPIDTPFIADYGLRLNIVPVPNLFRDLQIDAALSGSGDLIVDERYHRLFEEDKNHWGAKRLRFSVGHEIGHYVMHQEEIRRYACKSIEEFRSRHESFTNDQRAELQANEFAGQLLVPGDLLLEWYDYYAKRALKLDRHWAEHEGARERMARSIASHFGVNPSVIETRLDREGIWQIR